MEQKIIKSCVSESEGWELGGYVSLATVNEYLQGRRLVAVEYIGPNTTKFIFEEGVIVSIAPFGPPNEIDSVEEVELTIEMKQVNKVSDL